MQGISRKDTPLLFGLQPLLGNSAPHHFYRRFTMVEMFKTLWRMITKALKLGERVVDLGHKGIDAIEKELLAPPPPPPEV